MKFFGFAILLGVLFLDCAASKKNWGDFKNADCSKYYFGRIETKRLLTDAEKNELSIQGIQIQEFVFETQYLGSWELKWASRSFEKTPVKSLIPFSLQDKLASGMQLQELKKLTEIPGESMVLIQTIATVNPTELTQFGKLVFSREHFYRMIVPHDQLFNLLEFPCLRLLSIVKENYEADN